MVSVSPQPSLQQVDLPTVWHRPNFRGDRVKLPHYFVRGLGSRMEDVVAAFRNAARQRFGNQVWLAWAGESTNTPNVSRPLRLIRTLSPGHASACDVNFYAQSGDLYVRFESRPRTLTTYLRWLLYVVLFLILFTGGWAVLHRLTDQWGSMARSFANALQVDGNAPILLEYMLKGDPSLGGRAWTPADYIKTDPVLFMTSMGKIPMLLAAFVGGVLLLIPKDWINYPCRLLGFPRPDQFRNAVNQHNTQVEDVLSETLAGTFGVYKDQMIPVQDG